MPSNAETFLSKQRRLAGSLGLALLVFSPLFYLRALEDAYVLPQRAMALLGLALAFLGLGRPALGRSRLLWLGLLFFTWRWTASNLSAWQGPILPWMAEELPLMAAFLLTALAGRDEAWRRRLVLATGVAAALVAAVALFQLAGLDPFEGGSLDFGFSHRAHGSLGNPDFLAGYLVLVLPVAALAWVANAKTEAWSLQGGLALVVALALAFSQVRAAWLAALLGLGYALFLARSQILPKRLFALALLGLLALAWANPWSRLRAGFGGDNAWSGRRFMTQVGLAIAQKHPVLGSGPARFQQAFLEEQGRLLSMDAYRAEPYRFTADLHMDWVQLAANSGLPGFLLFVGIIALAWRASSGLKGPPNERAAMRGALVAFAVHACFHFPLGVQASALLFWMGMGWLAAQESTVAAEQGPSWAWMALPLLVALAMTGRQMNASAALNSGTWLKDHERAEQALPYLIKASQAWPEDARAWLRRGIVEDKLGRGQAAVTSFEKAATVSPGLPEAWANLSLALAKSGDLRAAMQTAEQALSLNPRAAEAWSNLAKIRYLQGDAAGALRDLEGGLDQAGPSPALYFNLGAIRLNQGEQASARLAFERCLALNPGHTEAARLLKGLGRAR